MKPIWGSVNQLGPDTWELVAPRDTPDHIGSVLAEYGPVPQVGAAVHFSWEPIGTAWGPDEDAGLWLMLLAGPGQCHPADYIRCHGQGFEHGRSMGGDKADQRIVRSLTIGEAQWASGVAVSHSVERVAPTGRVAEALFLSRWLTMGSNGWANQTILRSELLTRHWPPVLGLYCEGRGLRVRVN